MKTLLLFICTTFALQPMVAQQTATVSEQSKAVATYPFSDPNPVADPAHAYYPYFRFDGFSAKKTDKTWKTVDMENDYIKLTLYPEIGGKLWEAIDKTTGKAFIYDNHVIKFRDIAMRGPWTSGGIEFNFGIIGHAPTSSTPVDYYTTKEQDGSVSCHIASYEWVTRTYWDVKVNLPKDKAYFTTTTTWFNQSATDQPYYQWMNAGYKAAGNAEFRFPGDHFIGHGGELGTFPKDPEGRDLSWYKNNNFGNSKSEHVLGFYNDFYGIYWHDDDFGSVHHAGYDEKLGMKIFLWGQSREGGIWEGLLTDNDGQYVELQSGRMFNQPASNSAYSPYKHYAFEPQMTDQWTEYWFPVKGIGNITKAGRIGALHIERNGTELQLSLSPLADSNTTVTVYDGDQKIYSQDIQTKVLVPWTATVPDAGSIAQGKLKVVIGDQDLVYTENSNDYLLSRPKELPKEFDWNSLYGLYTQGEQWMNQKENDKAESFLKKALEKDPYYAPALNRLASLYERQGRLEEALGLLKTSLSLNAYDGEANYIYGLCNQRLGKTADAKDGFSIATYSSTFRSAAYAKLAEMYLKEGNMEKTEHYALKSLDYNRMNLDARQLLTICYRKTGHADRAAGQIHLVLTDMPLYHFARYENYLSGKSTVNEFTSLVRNELPAETYIEMGGWYESVGCAKEAFELYAFAKGNPIAAYRTAFLLHQQGRENEAAKKVAEADALSPDFIFPFRAETEPALRWAMTVSKSWKIKYYTGLICWANQRRQEALDLFEQCSDADYAPFYETRANLRKALPNGAKGSFMEDLLKAEQTETSWRTGFALLNAYTEQKDWTKVVATGEKYMKKYPANYYIGLKLATGYYESGKYASCLQLLKRLDVLPNEGAYAGRAIYRAANLYESMDFLKKKSNGKAQNSLNASMEWPENLGVGKPYDEDIDDRMENYLQGLIDTNAGRTTQAQEALKKVADYAGATGEHFASGNLLTAVAQRSSGQKSEADQWVASWQQRYPDNRIAEWCTAVYQGDNSRAQQLLESRNNTADATPWESSFRDTDFDLIVKLVRSGLLR